MNSTLKWRWMVLFIAMVGLVGCATTHIVSEDPHADIYLNGKFIGNGKAEVGSIGPPKTVSLEARKNGRTVGRTQMSRNFQWQTLVWGLFSYYTGLYWAWYYPGYVQIFSDYDFQNSGNSGTSHSTTTSPWNQPQQSIWMQPLKEK